MENKKKTIYNLVETEVRNHDIITHECYETTIHLINELRLDITNSNFFTLYVNLKYKNL